MATSSKPNSRFSSLKVFKFNAAPKPPPLPPKDPYYLPNPSLRSLGTSLSPDSAPSHPVTPLSAQYGRSPSPTPSAAPSRIGLSPYSSVSVAASTSTLNYPEPASSRRSLFKFGSFGKRPKTPKTADFTLAPPLPTQSQEAVDDPSISLPWNFQVSATPSFPVRIHSVLRCS
ncbi:uncharacterized protein BXZ73DRAFT_91892 [Epithele typhae]|uniref:uncharacterized protein n=1 Tax=Epithele typhae TaxID=378194 RepID=UPI002008D081|nr:uncharacterized protein BXZ73DRAFT_91892 [Epithele typhae]KAH9920881.1 hypothetical protein BXZ73DRAFT_91892 [Epithele typhae]